jgi:hypothetical protein
MGQGYELHCLLSWPGTSKLAHNQNFWAAAFDNIFASLPWERFTSAGVRLSLNSDGRLHTAIALRGHENCKSVLENVAGSLGAYDRVDGTRILLGTSAFFEEADREFVRALRMQPRYEQLSCADGALLYMKIDLAALLPSLLSAASRSGIGLCYEAVARPFFPEREAVRTIRYNLTALREAAGLPDELWADQAAVAEAVQSSAMLIDECIVINSEAYHSGRANEAVTLLNGQLENSIYARYGGAPSLVQIGKERAGLFSALMPSDYDLATSSSRKPLHEIAGKCACASAMMNRIQLAWIPMGRAGVIKHDIDIQLQQRLLKAGAGISPGPYAFISYARANEQAVLTKVLAIESRGVQCWMDREIRAGEKWDEELERRLAGCQAIIAFITRDYLASKNCLREAKFADALNRPIIPILERGVQLSGGLGLTFAGQQQFWLDDPIVANRVSDYLLSAGR